MNGEDSFGGAFGGTTQAQSAKEQIEAMIPALRVFEVTHYGEWNEEAGRQVATVEHIAAHSAMPVDGFVAFFGQRFEEPNRLVNAIIALRPAAEIAALNDTGPVPSASILSIN